MWMQYLILENIRLRYIKHFDETESNLKDSNTININEWGFTQTQWRGGFIERKQNWSHYIWIKRDGKRRNDGTYLHANWSNCTWYADSLVQKKLVWVSWLFF